MDEKLIRGVLLVSVLRKRFEKLGIDISSIGQFRGDVFIYLKDMKDKEVIEQLLMEDEMDIVSFFKA
jgi:hypothetical protein